MDAIPPAKPHAEPQTTDCQHSSSQSCRSHSAASHQFGLPAISSIEIDRLLQPVLTALEREGIQTDCELLAGLRTEVSSYTKDVHNRIDVSARRKVDLDSLDDVGRLLYQELVITGTPPRTKTGKYATGSDVLQKFRLSHPVVELILNHRELVTLSRTYLDVLPDCVSQATGRIYTTFSFTETGRLASSNPNLQNIPIRTELGRRIRQAFVPRDKEHILLSADYSQMELRILAALSNDSNLLMAFRAGEDIHTATAARLFDVLVESVSPDMRQRAKAVNYGIVYGMTSKGLAERLGVDQLDAVRLIAHLFVQFPLLKEYQQRQIAFARENGFVQSVFGRRRTIKEIHAGNGFIRRAAERAAINTPIQATAADMMKLAMIAINDAIISNQLKSRMILQVHDELLFDCYAPERDTLAAIVHDNMTRVIDFGVPFPVSMGFGKTWLEAHPA